MSIENNWKQKKCRHQWQWHKPHANIESNRIKSYKSYQISEDDIDLMEYNDAA